MASVCFYFQVHQPFRLRRYSVFDRDPFYFDNEANERIMRKIADKCYRPATAEMLDTLAVPTIGYRIGHWPRFISPPCGTIACPWKVESPAEAQHQ